MIQVRIATTAPRLIHLPRTLQRWMETRPSPISEYGAVYHDLRNRLLAGEWKIGDKLPSTADLMSHYDIRSLNTIRSAQAVLVEEGLILSHKGVGAFVIMLPQPALSAPTTDSVLEKARAARQCCSLDLARGHHAAVGYGLVPEHVYPVQSVGVQVGGDGIGQSGDRGPVGDHRGAAVAGQWWVTFSMSTVVLASNRSASGVKVTTPIPPEYLA